MMQRDFEAEFEALWVAYPRRQNNPKKAARDEYIKLGKKNDLPSLDEILRAARSYGAYCERQGFVRDKDRLIAQTRTWLHGMRWQEWLTPVDDAPAETIDMDTVPEVLRAFAERIGPNAWRMIFADCRISCSETQIVFRLRSGVIGNKIEFEYGPMIERMTGLEMDVEVQR